MIKIFFILFQIVASLFLFCTKVSAQEIKQVNIVNPVRGRDFWSSQDSLAKTPQGEYSVIKQNNLSATWLIRYDGLKDSEITSFIKGLDQRQEVGLFLEVTPTLTKDSGVIYNNSPNWHYARSAFLIGYSPSDRVKMIDRAVNQFKSTFGYTPKSVGAWWIDAYSLNYLHDKYGILADLDVADQYSTDQYQVWGQYFSSPFYPSKVNALIPAGSANQKIGIVTIQWATRDPFNSYGNGVADSTYSVQVNDYTLHKLDTHYFEKLLDIYPQVTVGLENDFSWDKYGFEYSNQIKLLSSRVQNGLLQTKTMSDFARYYSALYPDVSPALVISANNPLGDGKVVWYQTTKYRVGYFYGPYGSVIRDLRIYNDSSKEPCLEIACSNLNFAASFISVLDEVTLGKRLSIDEGNISDFKLVQKLDDVEISYINQSGVSRLIRFLPNDVEINGKIQTIDALILNVNIPSPTPKGNDSSSVSGGIKNLNSTLVSVLKFLILVLVFFFLPGWVITRDKVLAVPVGWAVFTLIGFVGSYLNFNLAIWALPLLSLAFIKRSGLPNLNLKRLEFSKTALIIVGSFTWLLTTIKSGLEYSFGLGFWGPNGHDAIWHLALIEELKKNVPPSIPTFSGVLLHNYHYFFDLLLAKSSLIFNIDSQDLLFRLFPALIAPLAGLLVYRITQKLFHNHLTSLLAAFFLYFGGSFGWVISYFRYHNFGGESIFWSQQSISTLLNPPFAISIVLLLAGFDIFMDLRRSSWLMKISLIILWGTLVEFKVYAGMLTLAGFGLAALIRTLKGDWQLTRLFIFTFILSLIVFLPNNLGAQSLVALSPFWLVNSMIDFPDRLGWERLALARQAYLATGNIFKLIFSETAGLLIFLVGNLGSRTFLLLGFGKGKLDISIETKTFLGTVLLLGMLLPLLFIQKGNDWNIIQFFYYCLLIADILAAFGISQLLKKFHKIKWLVVFVLILVTIPTTFDTLSQYIPSRPPAKLSQDEQQALAFLKNQPDGTVMTLPFDKNMKDNFSEPLPLLVYAPTAYVAALSSHETFLEDTINLEILGVDYKGRLNDEMDFIKLPSRDREILHRNNIKYVYINKAYNFQENESQMGIKKIFENNEVKIFKVNES